MLEGFVERDVQRLRDHGGQPDDAVERHVEDPAHVLDGGLGGHGAEGADLGHALFAVLLPDVVDDFLAAVLAKVDVDVGRLASGWDRGSARTADRIPADQTWLSLRT